MHKKRFVLLKTFIANLLLVVIVTQVKAASQPNPGSNETSASQEWITYTDPRFDFSVEYPATWHLIPRDDSNPAAVSGVLTFTLNDLIDEEASGGHLHEQVINPNITIGLYLAELAPGQSLGDWTALYEETTNALDEYLIQRQPRRVLEVNGTEVIREIGVSPMTEYQFTNLAHGKTVWFIWTNIGDSANATHSAIYEQMVNSFQFGKNTPTTLRDVYGDDFKSIDLDDLSKRMSNLLESQPKTNMHLFSPLTPMTKLDSSWFSPVLNGSSGQYYARCGSTAHIGSSAYAVDVNAPYQKAVYSAKVGTKILAVWGNTGYGNHVILDSWGKYHYYAHLSYISYNVINGSWFTSKYWLGNVGNSGTTEVHLHFHVKEGSNPVLITGMVGFGPFTNAQPPDVNYPSSSVGNCGRMGR
ncbi:MAG: M23 family metallopeptidase [Anaerolineae bacterium]|nr:M23 family metallopeptidase [Anaerolineae bacterium]